jgi:anti-sigma regulatory factor (Ser/Thr protein kinase)
VTRTEAVYIVRDEGPGFDFTLIPHERDPAAIERDDNRGLLLIRTFMDEVRYNARGNEITMIKRRDLPETEAHDESAGGRRQPGAAQAASAPPH